MTIPTVPRIFSHNRRLLRAERAERRTGQEECASWLMDEIEHDLIERIGFMKFEPARALILGRGHGQLEAALERQACQVVAIQAPDEEQPITGAPFDLIVSLARLDTVNDLPGALIHLRTALGESGILLASFVGAGSLPALRQIMLAADGDRPAARLHPQIDSRAASTLLQRVGFTRQVVDTLPLRLRYSALNRLIADLRDQGLTNALADQPPTLGKSALARARAAFDNLRDDDGRVTETFEIMTLTVWR